MIGTFIRSAHHLKHSGGFLTPIKVIGIRQHNIVIGDIIVGVDKNEHDIYFFFQEFSNNVDNRKISSYCNAETAKVVSEYFNKHPRCIIYLRYEDLQHNFGNQFIMLPNTFDNLYNDFCQKNKKVLSSVFSKLLNKDDTKAKALFVICESANLFSWAVKCLMIYNIAFMTIYRIMYWQKTYSQLVGKLKKGTITAYNDTNNVLALLDECIELRKNKRANDIINFFNTEQKKLLKSNFDKIPKDLLSKFALLSSTKKRNFIRKVSTITDLDEILRLMSFTTSAHFAWNKQSLLDYIKNVEGLNCKIVLENETSVLVEVNDYDTIKKLAKTTNWCISKNKSYWNNYMGRKQDTTQYVLFDFSKKEDDELSIVGFTTCNNKGITHAHSFTNANLMESSNTFNGEDLPYRDLLRGANTRNGIYAVIANNNIPLSLITRFRSRFANWTREAFFEIFENFIPKGTYTIYHDEDNKIVISTKNINGIFELLGDKYINKFGDNYRMNEHIFFIDFNKNTDDNDKIKYTIVVPSNFNKTCSSTTPVYNEFGIKSTDKFNKVIKEMKLPYDIICRPDTIKNRFCEALSNHDLIEMEEYIEDSTIKSILDTKHNSLIKQIFKQELMDSILSYNSIQLIEMLKKHNYTINNLLSLQDIRRIFEHFYNNTCSCGGHNFADKNITKEKLFDDLLNHNFNEYNTHQQYYILHYYIADYFLKPYINDDKALRVILDGFISCFTNYYYGGLISRNLISLLFKFIDFNTTSSSLMYFLQTIFYNNDETNIKKLLNIDIKDENVRNLILSFAPRKTADEFKSKWGMKEKVTEYTSDENKNVFSGIKYTNISIPDDVFNTIRATYATTVAD